MEKEFSGHYRSLRSFGGRELKSDKLNRLSIPENQERHITCPRVRIDESSVVRSFRSLEVIWRSFGGRELKSDKRNSVSILENPAKDI